ncbi:hypothetical protein JYU34_005493 [Plutella xylostella]|uniref:Uncharacterized protein n=1 Tax=Plutella xylostella TaxID=51655 RepID=A0ABQ7QWV0_PLUXY|nr:hypothetical protein JYU34_005493 [Plutella xylostella]
MFHSVKVSGLVECSCMAAETWVLVYNLIKVITVPVGVDECEYMQSGDYVLGTGHTLVRASCGGVFVEIRAARGMLLTLSFSVMQTFKSQQSTFSILNKHLNNRRYPALRLNNVN